MYAKVMVPLDGSELAECVLPHVEAFVKAFQVSDVVLVRVVETDITPFYSENIVDPQLLEWEEKRKSIARQYLKRIRERCQIQGATVDVEVLAGRVTETLTEFAMENAIDLIILATHGRSGMTRWIMGSVADKLIRSASVPVLIVRTPGAQGEV